MSAREVCRTYNSLDRLSPAAGRFLPLEEMRSRGADFGPYSLLFLSQPLQKKVKG